MALKFGIFILSAGYLKQCYNQSVVSRGDEIGKHSGLKNLSACVETCKVEPFKFGELPA